MEQEHTKQRKEVRCQIENGTESHGGKKLGQQRENTVRRKFNQHSHHFHHNNFHILEPGNQTLPRLTRTCQCEAHE